MSQSENYSNLVTAVEQNDSAMLKQALEMFELKIDVLYQGRTALQEASRKGNLEMIRMLIRKHADINICDIKDQTPLHYAVCGNQPLAVDLLLKLGAKVGEEDNEGCTAPQLAFKEQKRECVAVFLKRDPKISLKIQSAETNDPKMQVAQVHEHPIEQRKEVQMCHYCKEEPARLTFEPCGCKLACLKCSTRVLACMSCGREVQKISFVNSDDMLEYIKYIEDLEKEVADLKQDKICSICTENKIDCVLQCGHLFCEKCVKKGGAGRNDNDQKIWKCFYKCEPSRYLMIYPK